MTKKAWIFPVLCLALSLASFAQSSSSVSTPSRVSVEPVSTVVVKPGQNSEVEFTLHVQQGFHINSNQPTIPELKPTELHFSPPSELIIARLQYPAGSLLSFPFDPDSKLSVYSGDVTVKAKVIAQSSATPGPYTVHGELMYQACDNNSCYPPKKLPVDFTVKVAKDVRPRAHGNAQSPHIH
ncbi:MAG TPA: protein-disulfide reductase DsbD domain-containing protein [Candidatus Angelobacter sp.]|nr:protein-disulfide reductase DsbD domain-containing protein [Candidatus Angelobacter sp.]